MKKGAWRLMNRQLWTRRDISGTVYPRLYWECEQVNVHWEITPCSNTWGMGSPTVSVVRVTSRHTINKITKRSSTVISQNRFDLMLLTKGYLPSFRRPASSRKKSTTTTQSDHCRDIPGVDQVSFESPWRTGLFEPSCPIRVTSKL